MIITFTPQGEHSTKLSFLRVNGDTITINDQSYDLAGIPEGATLPEVKESDFILGKVERIDGELHVNVLLPFDKLPQPEAVLFPDPVKITSGEVELPYDN